MKQGILFLFMMIFTINSQSESEVEAINFQTCIFLARFYANEQITTIRSVLQTYQDQTEQSMAWNKIYISIVKECLNRITLQISYEILNEMQQTTFEFQNHGHIFLDFDANKFNKGQYSLQLTERENEIAKKIYDFETKLKQGQQENKEDQHQNYDREPTQQEVNQFGFKLQEIAVFGSMLFVVVFLIYAQFCVPNKEQKDEKNIKYTENQNSIENDDQNPKKKEEKAKTVNSQDDKHKKE